MDAFNVTLNDGDDIIDTWDYIDMELLENYYYPGDIENLRKPWIHEAHFIPTVILYGITFIVGVVGNLLVVFAIIGDRKCRSVTTSFMVSLAIADLLFLLICVPYETARHFIGHWSSGNFLCKLSGFANMLSAVSSILNLTAVSVERYIVIVHPMKSRSWCTLGNTKKILIITWLAAILLSAASIHVMHVETSTYYNNETSVTLAICADTGIPPTDRLVFAIYQLIAMLAAPTAVMVYCYACVIYVLWLSSKDLLQMTSPESRKCRQSSGDESKHRLTGGGQTVCPQAPPTTISYHRQRRSDLRNATREHSVEILKARKQVIKMLITIVTVFVLSWGPTLIYKIMRLFRLTILYTQTALWLKLVFDCLPYIQSCLNPIIYGFMSRNFRKSIRVAFYASICRRARCSRCCATRPVFGDYEMESRSANGTVHTKLSLRTKNSSSDEYRE